MNLHARHLAPLLLLFLFAGAVVAGTDPLVDPAPIAVPAGLTGAQVHQAVKGALSNRGWQITAQRDGHVDATLYLRDHIARIGIDYDPQAVKVAYVSSEHLDEGTEDGVRVIHSRYLTWIEYLDGDIDENLKHTVH